MRETGLRLVRELTNEWWFWRRNLVRNGFPLVLFFFALVGLQWVDARLLDAGSQSLPGVIGMEAYSLGIETPRSSFEPFPKSTTDVIERTHEQVIATAFSARLDVDLSIDGRDLGRHAAERIAPNYFRALNLAPVVGSWPLADGGEGPTGVVIGERLWARLFERDPGVIGRRVQVNAIDAVVIAIAPQAFDGVALDTDVWIAGGNDAEIVLGRSEASARVSVDLDYSGVALLPAGTEAALLSSRLAVLDDALRVEGELGTDERLTALPSIGRDPLRTQQWLREFRLALTFALMVCGFAIVVVGVQRIMAELTRAAASRTLVALGGCPRSIAIARFVAIVATILLTLASAWCVFRLLTLAWGHPAASVSLRWALPLVIVAIAVVAVPVGVMAFRSMGPAPSTASTRGRINVFRILLGAVNGTALLATAMTVALLISYRNSDERALGFDPEGLSVYGVDNPPGSRLFAYLSLPQTRSMVEAIHAAMTQAEISNFALTVSAPLTVPKFFDHAGVPVELSGAPTRTPVVPVACSDNLFEVLNVPLIAGRARRSGDDASSVVVNHSFAVQVAETVERSIGRSFRAQLSGMEGWREFNIIGVVPDLEYALGAARHAPRFFRDLRDSDDAKLKLIVRDGPPVHALSARLRNLPNEFYPGLYFQSGSTLSELQADRLSAQRSRLMVAMTISVIQGLIAAVASFGLWQLSFRIRQRDLALRMALGAGPASLRRLLIAEVIRLSAVTGAIAIPALWITCLQATDLALSSMHWMLCFSGTWMVQLGVVLACALLAQRKLLRPDISRILRASD